MTAPPPFTDDRRRELLARLATEPSDTKLSDEFGISRKTIWRMRQKQTSEGQPAPSESQVMAKVVVPNEPKQEAPMPVEPVPVEPVSVAPPPVKEAPRLREDPRPKVDVEPVLMGTYFAVQLLPRETYREVALAVLNEADMRMVLFRKLQVLDIITVGATSFVRFRSDVTDVLPITRALVNRGSIVEIGGTYSVKFTNGKIGKFPGSAMCVSPKIGFGHTYAGTRIKRWKQQFAA